MKCFFCLPALLCFFVRVVSQDVVPLKPLSIGDTFPPLVFNAVVNHPVSKIQFADYNSGLLILDFWATWCSSCISQFPKISLLSKTFAGKVQFLLVPFGNSSADSLKVLRFFASRNASYRLPSLTKDSLLYKLFPHQALPHYVWINKGIVVAVTDASAITGSNISAVLNNTSMNMHEKKDRLYNAGRSLLENAGAADSTVSVKTSTTLTGYLNGFSTMGGYTEKNGSITYYAINSPLLTLYSLAFHDLEFLPANRIIWNEGVNSNYIPDASRWDEWKLTHSYCFEFRAASADADRIPVMIKRLLDNYFGLVTGFENRAMLCVVLSAGKKFTPIPRATTALVNTLEEKGMPRRLHGSSQSLSDYLDQQLPIPVINGLKGELLDITLPDEPMTLEKLKEWLAPYGLELIPTEKSIRVFSISKTL